TVICARVPSRPRSIVVITVCGGIALPLSSGLVRLLPFASSYELYTFRANRAIRVCGAVWSAGRWWHVATRPRRRADISTPVGTCPHLSAPSAGGVLVGPPLTACSLLRRP